MKSLVRIVLLCVSLISCYAQAETIPATGQWYFGDGVASCQSGSNYFCSANSWAYARCPQVSCNGVRHGDASVSGSGYATATCAYSCGATGTVQIGSQGQSQLGCPTTGGWTLSGSNCTRPDCPQGQDRNEAGVCVAPPCQSGESISFSIFSGYSVGANAVVGAGANPYTNGSNRCNGTCTFNVTSITNCPAQVGTVDNPKPITCHGTGVLTGATCSIDESVGSTAPLIPNHRPKCLAGEGVLTTSSGTVACVPSGTPSSAPVVRTSTQTEQFPDGSTRTTETTYTKDPVSQVQDTQQQITNTPATGGGAGTAGPIGTTSNSGSATPSSGDGKEAADFCRLNAQLQICKGDMNKEETQIQVRDYIKSLTDPGSTPFTKIDQAKQSTKSDDDLKEQTDKFQAAAEGTFSPDSASRNSWQSAMDSGWFEPVTRQGCTPYSATIGGRTWNLDICPTAEKISVISEYVIWFMLVVGTFVMLTGGVFSRNS